MMVVVVIIGIVVAGALLSLGNTGRDRGLTQERDRLVNLIAYVRDRGSLLTLEYGIRCGIHGYTFSVYDSRLMQWVPDTDDDVLRNRKLPPGLSLRLVIEGRQIVLDDKTLNAPASAAPKAAAVSSGSNGTAAPGLFTGGSLDTQGGSLTGSGSGSGSGSGAAGSGDLLGTTVDYTPQVMLYSNGDTNSFALTITRDSTGRSVTLKSNDAGDIEAGDVVEGKSR
jgi:type II secretory pathway pseudopilin PulG